MNIVRQNIDIAIIGLSCRFPGAATAEEFWNNLCEGVESIKFFSDQELKAAGVNPNLVANPNYVKAAPMLRDVEMFDAEFFGYSPKEAALMDPQQRLFLEVCWEAFENAGYDPAGYTGKVGVLSTAGGVVTSYLLANLHHADLPGQTASISHIANDKDFLSTRVSFKLNLRGPSFAIQSACSSSLLAVHQACQTLRLNECDMMLVGGAVVRVPQVEGYMAEKRNVHSLDGHCRPFDSAGQGTIFGSGVAAVLLKPLERAVADRDHIFAVIGGTAANNDGATKSSYTAPSLGQQSETVVDALKLAGASADSVGYVECHATGTKVGDPLEIDALTTAFRKETDRKQYCAVGSVKGNIGHPEQAAGIAGLIKTALVLYHKRIPPTINYDRPNSAIDFAASPFYVNAKLCEFPLADTPRRAGLNSLGIGGTNVFAVLQEAPPAGATRSGSPGRSPCLVTLSAKTADALVARVEQFLNWLNDNPDAQIGDVCYTTNVSRSQFAFRFAAPAQSTDELKKTLTAWLRATTKETGGLRRADTAPIAFMFSGQGSQYSGMAANLYETNTIFREAMNKCNVLAEPYLEQGLLDVIFARGSDAAPVNQTEYTQPALFAVEYALVELLKYWGITPTAVIGHSLGELSAACTSGVMTLEDAMQLVVARGALMRRLPSGGGMIAIFADESLVRSIIEKTAPEIAVAATNGPLNTVVSGGQDALRVLAEELDRQKINYHKLQVSNAFHSPRTESILDDLESIAGQIEYYTPKIHLISNVTGELMSRAPDKFYWRRHLREAVRFGDGMLALAELGCRTFVEVGPHPVLLPIAQSCPAVKGKSATWVATLNHQKSDVDSIVEMLVALYRAGHNPNWAAVHADSSWRRLPLPTYPFRRKRYWLDNNAIYAERARKVVERRHPLVGARTTSMSNEARYEARYGVRHARYLSDHRIAGTIVLPTSAELEAATVVGRMHFGTSRISFDNVMHHQAMSFANGEDRTVRVLVTPLKSDSAGFELASASTQGLEIWHTHMTGTLHRSKVPSRPAFSTMDVRARCERKLPVADFYDRLDRLGLEYGPSFRGVREICLGRHEALTKVWLPDGLVNEQYVMHPAFIDACLHSFPLVLEGAEQAESDCRASYLPISLAGFRCYQDGIDHAWVHTKLRSVEKNDTQVVDIRIYDDAEQPVAELEGLTVRLLALDKLQRPPVVANELLYRAIWRKSTGRTIIVDNGRASASWIIFADAKGIGAALAGRLEAAGHRCHLVYRDHAFAQRGTRTWTVNEQNPQDFRQFLEKFAVSETLPCDGVVYLWGPDAPSVESLTLEGLKSGSEMMCRGALSILHALAETRSTNLTGRRLWFVTTNTQKIDVQDEHVDPVQASLWGLGRTAAIEYPGIWGGLIDLQLNPNQMPNIDLLVAELLDPDGESQIAISADGQRQVSRLVRQSLSGLQTQALRILGNATYLVTGGLGMLGRNVAEWLIGKGAKHLVLTGRNANADAARELINGAETNGAAIHVVAADISKDGDVSRLMQWIAEELPPLKGVVQSAGVLDDGILAQLGWDRFERIFGPKVYGSWLLHKYTKSLELDFFILKSSLLSLLGSAGQGNYAAGNAFLDSLVAYRRTEGLPATAINWSAWSGGGLATASGARGEAMWSSLGVKFVAPDLAMQIFDELMCRDVGQVAVAIVDWPTYASKVGNPPFLADLLSSVQDSDSPKSGRGVAAPNAQAIDVNNNARQQLLSRLQERIMAELGFDDPIDINRPLNEIGLDSLRSVTLANALEDEFGTLLSITKLISGPTINELAEHLFDLLAGIAKSDPEPESASVLVAATEAADKDGSIAGAEINPTPLPAAHGIPRAPIVNAKFERDPLPIRAQPQEVISGHTSDAITAKRGANGSDPQCHAGSNERVPPARGQNNGAETEDHGIPVLHSTAEVTSRAVGKWLIAPQPNPHATARFFCFPYAGGGLASFRTWGRVFGDTVEVVAVEPPGRGTRINEPAVDNLNVFVESLLPEIVDWLDRPSAFFGHCLGGLTMFATLCALPKARAHFIKYAFACGVKPPHLLSCRGEFEDNLVYDMMLNREFDARLPPYAQSDEIFADIIRQFGIPAANRMLEIPTLRKALLPAIRAEFGMAYNYVHQPVEPFSFPISSFVGSSDPWVSKEASAGWGELTRGRFNNHVRNGSHFLMADDEDYIVETIDSEFVIPLAR